MGRVTCQGPDGESVRWFSNVAGAGFDAFVVERLAGRKHSRWSYLAELLRSARHFQAPQISIEAANGRVSRRSLAVFAGLGRYCGGGMEVAPDALLDDGHADVTLVHDMSLWQLIGELRRLFDRSVPRSAHVTTQRTAWLTIESPSAVSVQADGELVGHLPARIEVIPGAIRVIAPAAKGRDPGSLATPAA